MFLGVVLGGPELAVGPKPALNSSALSSLSVLRLVVSASPDHSSCLVTKALPAESHAAGSRSSAVTSSLPDSFSVVVWLL